MKITSRFTVAVHTLLVIYNFSATTKVTSDFIAASVQVNPVVIRRTLLSLKAAGMVDVKAGSGGASIIKDMGDITLYDVYKAVDSMDGDMFHFHENPNPACPVGRNIHAVLDAHLADAQAAMENELKNVTLLDLTKDLAGKPD
ncbi:MAG TPA: Rrf2 family transcriptional regulator [Candidatus Gallimonas intestinigallinarum]|uniref:Rrf2 family transcriptional regulator n=1 Tax=Candidatus Gallimonas intestinigallinarum TaxID=2838604 RepID=A0A9D2IUE9_9FIRM|nr:Rrf2 family transcriptional regulator [Candidatus Gallimonas intestinigallinarum]